MVAAVIRWEGGRERERRKKIDNKQDEHLHLILSRGDLGVEIRPMTAVWFIFGVTKMKACVTG